MGSSSGGAKGFGGSQQEPFRLLSTADGKAFVNKPVVQVEETGIWRVVGVLVQGDAGSWREAVIIVRTYDTTDVE